MVEFGLEQSFYSVAEAAGFVEVCVVAIFVDEAQGSVDFTIFTSPETASGRFD